MGKQIMRQSTIDAARAAQSLSLKGWQQDILNEIEAHEEKRESDQYQGLGDYTISRILGVTVAMPRGSGHTTFANLIASRYPTLLVYGRMDHYKRITGTYPLHEQSNTISIYEIFHGMYKSNGPNVELQTVRDSIAKTKVVVVDNAMSVSEDIRNFIYDSACGLVVMLGQ